MTKLAIKGHATRGQEVIQLLEMLGGNNNYSRYCGYNPNFNTIYYIDSSDRNFIKTKIPSNISDFSIFTLEDFEKKFPYKVGDKVILDKSPCIITEMSWYCDNVFYYVEGNDFSKDVCSTDKNLQPYKEENMETIKIDIPKGYEFTKIDNDKQQIVFTKIQSQYPNTYEECCEVLVGRKPTPNEISFDKMELCLFDANDNQSVDFLPPQLSQLNGLFRLLMCRNAYWKFAGKEMGLNKPWKPDWNDCAQHKFGLYTLENEIRCINLQVLKNIILVFPTEEMRNTFYENFKELIEQCKELL